jgi:hypothetical protein
MRNRRYLIGALVGVVGALAISGVANAAPTGQTLAEQLTPAKQSAKTFGGVSLFTDLRTTLDNPATTQSPRQTVFTIPKDVKFTAGNIPACPLTAIQGKFDAQARAACPQSITGQGNVEVNNGAVKGNVTFFSGGPTTIYVQTDIGPGATTLTIIGTIQGQILTFSNIPNTPGLVLTRFVTTFNKRKTGKKSFYVSARCKKGKWATTETTTFYSGEVFSATATQKCKAKGGKKK